MTAAGLYVIMLQFNPDNIAVGRYPALHDWIYRLLHGMFPYQSPTNPSGLPMLFILTIPFYLIGDLGLFQIAGFVIFCFSAGHIFRDNTNNRLFYPILLLCSPIFLYEIIVRSELFSNMALVILFVLVAGEYAASTRKSAMIILGLLGGLLLSTRAVVLLLYLVFFGEHLRMWRRQYLWFIGALIVGFMVTLIPFMIWDWDYFIHQGPFAVQSIYAPLWLVITALVAAIISGMKIQSLRAKFMAAAYLMFVIVVIAFLYGIADYGWTRAITGDQFDISYFCLVLPFLIPGLDFSVGRNKTT